MGQQGKRSWWRRAEGWYQRHKKLTKIVLFVGSAVGPAAGYYTSWSPIVHDWLTPQFVVEVHRSWVFQNLPMTTPFRSARTDTCGSDQVDEFDFVEVKNNHRYPATVRSISLSIKDWAGWHKVSNVEALTPFVFIPDIRQCHVTTKTGNGCYFHLDGDRLDASLPHIVLAPRHSASGYLLIRWDDFLAADHIQGYGVVVVDDKGNRTRLRDIDPPTGPSHANDVIQADYTVMPVGWEPSCQQIIHDADR
jgi:hypothetical protein